MTDPVQRLRPAPGHYADHILFGPDGLALTVARGKIPPQSPYQVGDWVILHGHLKMPAGPRRWGFRGYVTGYLGSTLLCGVTDDGRAWGEHWGALQPDGTACSSASRCTCHPGMPRRPRRMGHMDVMTVPRLIHWWWDGSNPPQMYLEFLHGWRRLHPDWEIATWNEERFLQEFEPDHPVVNLYQNRARWSPRSHEWGWKTNIARYAILQRLGGVWVDADLEPLKSIDPLISKIEGTDTGFNALAGYEDHRHVNNAFLASLPGGAFINAVVDGLPARVRAKRNKPSNVVTGPHYLTELAGPRSDLLVLDRSLIYPMHWSELDRRGESFPDAFTLHHWHRKTTEQTRAKVASAFEVPERFLTTPQTTTVKTRSKPTRPKVRKLNMVPPTRIRKIAGLTPEPVAVALADMASQVPSDRAIVELGVYQGRTTLFMAWGARQGNGAHIYAIDPWDLPGDRGPYRQNQGGALGKHRKAFTDPGTRSWARYNVKALGYGNRVTLIRNFSVQAGQKWSVGPVGLLFVDGDHNYDAVRADVSAWTPHLAPDAVIAFDDYAVTHPEVIRAVDDMVGEGILEPVEVFHDRLAVTRLGSGHPELVRRELEQMPEVRRAEEARQELADAILTEAEISVPRGGVTFTEVDGRTETEREADRNAEAVRSDGRTETEREADHQAEIAREEIRRRASVPPAEGRPIQAVGRPEMISAAGDPPGWEGMTTAQLRKLAGQRGLEIEGDKRVRENVLAALRSASEGAV